jgi:uncharacterized protein YaiI (UPF0178 family)
LPITILIDADACPVKDEVYRVAERHIARGVSVTVAVVSNSGVAVPKADFIERVVVPAGPDAADDWIVNFISASMTLPKTGSHFSGSCSERASPTSIVVTADIPLASRAVKAGAAVIAPNGRAFTEESIGLALAQRNLMDSLRSAGAVTGGPKPFGRQDRSAFLSALDQAVRRAARVVPKKYPPS